jgi:hypothetical protein
VSALIELEAEMDSLEGQELPINIRACIHEAQEYHRSPKTERVECVSYARHLIRLVTPKVLIQNPNPKNSSFAQSLLFYLPDGEYGPPFVQQRNAVKNINSVLTWAQRPNRNSTHSRANSNQILALALLHSSWWCVLRLPSLEK